VSKGLLDERRELENRLNAMQGFLGEPQVLANLKAVASLTGADLVFVAAAKGFMTTAVAAIRSDLPQRMPATIQTSLYSWGSYLAPSGGWTLTRNPSSS
jgi:hypothetical protein